MKNKFDIVGARYKSIKTVPFVVLEENKKKK